MIVRQMLLQDSTKKFIIWSHTQSMELEQQLINEEEQLVNSKKSDRLRESISRGSNNFYVNGSPIDQLLAIHDWVEHDRYESIIHLYFTIFEYAGRVTAIEKSYRHVYALMEHTNQTDHSTDKTKLVSSDIHMRSQVAARIALLRCYLVVLSDFLYLRSQTRCHTVVKFNIEKASEECKQLAEQAQETKYIRHEAEGRIFYSKLVALTRQANRTVGPHDSNGEEYNVEKAREHLSKAKALILGLSSAVHLRKEIGAVRRMLVDGVFFRGVSVEEKRVIWKAMTEEIREVGH
ncbi:hypothetical protein F4814DRAFT_407102 [Daldinia grandis]|nr:hypothetical protein F4814DRAFT_407102 [Daldinia grandis]